MQYSLGSLTTDDEHVERGTVAHELHRARRLVGKRQFAVVGRMIEHSIDSAGEIERDILVATAVVHALSVLVLKLERLTGQVHLAEPFARSGKALVVLAFE